MSSPVSFSQPQALPPQAFGCGPAQQRPMFGAARDTVHFGGRDENRQLLDEMRSRPRAQQEKPEKEKRGSVGKGFGKSVKYGCGSMALSVVAGLACLAAAPFSLALSAIPGIALIVGSPLVGFFGATIGFLKGKTLG